MHPLRVAIGAAMIAAMAMTMPSSSVRADDARFEESARVADAALAEMRGGFAGDDGGMLRFAVDLTTAVDGHTVASLSVSNDASGKITATAQNIGSVFVVNNGSGGLQVVNQSGSGSIAAGATLVNTTLLPNGNGVMTLIQNGQSKVVVNSVATLDIRLSGIGNPLLHNTMALQSFANAMRSSVRH